MADYREVQHGFTILKNFLSNEANRKQFDDALESCAPGAMKEAIALFDQWWNSLQFNTFITSISEHDKREDLHGRLSMWRAFGGNAARVAFVLNIPWRTDAGRALGLTFSPVAYATEQEMNGVLLEVIQNVKRECEFLSSLKRSDIVGILFTMFVASVTCSKHEGFREEREWRAIYSPNRLHSPLMEPSIETVNGIPQTIFQLPLDGTLSPAIADLDFAKIFDKLIIGPSQFPAPLFQAFLKTLNAAGITDVEKRIVISGIPIRT
jgi:hypothetical protein